MTLIDPERPKTTATKRVSLTWKEFEEKFRPITNHLIKDPNQKVFETFGVESEFVISQILERKVWTWADGVHRSFIRSGYHYEKRIGYYVCEVPYEKDTEYEIVVSRLRSLARRIIRSNFRLK